MTLETLCGRVRSIFLGESGIDQMLPDPHGGILVSTTAADQIHGGTVALLFKIDLEGQTFCGQDTLPERGRLPRRGPCHCCRRWILLAAVGSGIQVRANGCGYYVRRCAEPLVPLPLIQLKQNFPNPFNSITTISYSLPRTMHVTLRVDDLTGREGGTLVEATKQAGEHHIRFDANMLSSGVYFYQLQAGQFSETRKLLLIR
ncbi:MAG: T9SS type A sorting domain-containing protein [bacterium]|nr:T9SS type A sorting domain-containing protein [bacterium]